MGLFYKVHKDGFYTISSRTDSENHSVVRLIESLPFNNRVHGSKNGNDVQAIGRFKFKFPSSELEPDIFVFAFHNTSKKQVEFLIIPKKEFLRRHTRMNPQSPRRKSMMLVFWLMDNECIYNATNITPEAEWFFLSSGVNGRLADRSELDFSDYLNKWQMITT